MYRSEGLDPVLFAGARVAEQSSLSVAEQPAKVRRAAKVLTVLAVELQRDLFAAAESVELVTSHGRLTLDAGELASLTAEFGADRAQWTGRAVHYLDSPRMIFPERGVPASDR